MYKKSFLFPHSCQQVGWWLILTCLILAVTFLCVIENTSDSFNTMRVLQASIVVLSSIGLLLLCLSKEKIEDEYISYLRIRTTTWIIVYVFVVSAIRSILLLILPWFASVSVQGSIFTIMSVAITNPILLGIVYLIIFKLSIWFYNRKSQEDGQ